MFGSFGEPLTLLMCVVPSLPVARASARVLKSFRAVHDFDRLADRSWAGVYVQPLQLDTKRDSVASLVAVREP